MSCGLISQTYQVADHFSSLERQMLEQQETLRLVSSVKTYASYLPSHPTATTLISATDYQSNWQHSAMDH